MMGAMQTVISRWTQELSSPDPLVRRDAARALGEARAVEAVPALCALLRRPAGDDESHPEHASRAAAAVALGRIGDPTATDVLLETIADPFNAGTAASTALGRLIPPPVGELVRMTRDANAWRRARAVVSLGEIRDPSAFDAMVVLLDDPDLAVRRAAASAFEKLRDPRAASPLVALMTDAGEPVIVRSYAAMALGALKVPSTVDALLRTLDAPEALLRRAVARALCRIGDPRAREPLARLAEHDPDRTVRQVVSRYLSPRPGQRQH